MATLFSPRSDRYYILNDNTPTPLPPHPDARDGEVPQVGEQCLGPRDTQHDTAEHLPPAGPVIHEEDDDPMWAEALEHGGPIRGEVVGTNTEDGSVSREEGLMTKKSTQCGSRVPPALCSPSHRDRL